MNILKHAIEEVWGLFVDDPIFAASIIIWVVVIKLLLGKHPHVIAGPVLFVGLVVVLVSLTYRQALSISKK
jgi:hypothetical protein